MPQLDPSTAFIMNGVLYLLLPAITWVVLMEQRSAQVALWCGGGVMVGIGLLLVGLRGNFPDWLTFTGANTLFMASHFARVQALLLDRGKSWSPRWMLMGVGLFALTHYLIGTAAQRAQFAMCVFLILLCFVTWQAWCIGREEGSRSARWIAWVYGIVVCALLYRLFSVSVGSAVGNALFDGVSTQFLAIALLLSSVIGHLGYVGISLDRAMRRELKNAADQARDDEKRRLGEQIAQLDRQRSLGEMSASLGHELNQPLTAILTNAQVARRGLQSDRFSDEQHREFLDKIIHNTQRASQIIDRIRGFIRPTATRNEPVDLHIIVREVSELIADEARSSNVTLVLPAAGKAVQVSGDAIQLSQIVLNVLRNAIEAVRQVAHRQIHITCVEEGGRALLRIRDSGPGLTAEALAQVGTPFFTTKSAGLGMGLSISSAIAAQHAGTLTLSNSKEGGVVVELNLPALPGGTA
jgi:signal transduction histidine kinase